MKSPETFLLLLILLHSSVHALLLAFLAISLKVNFLIHLTFQPSDLVILGDSELSVFYLSHGLLLIYPDHNDIIPPGWLLPVQVLSSVVGYALFTPYLTTSSPVLLTE